MIVVKEGRYLRLVGGMKFRNRLALLPGRWFTKDDQFFCEPVRANIEFIEGEFPEAEWRCTDRELIEELRAKERGIVGRKLDLARFAGIVNPTAPPPFSHQGEALCLSADELIFAYLMEMGTGKTRVFIENAVYLYDEDKIDAVVLVAPNGVHAQFINEQLPQWAHPSCPLDTFIYRSGGNSAFLKRKKEFLRPKKGCLRVLAINVEALSHKSGVKYLEQFFDSIGVAETRTLMGVDESTRIKSVSASRAKNVRRLGRRARYRRILTGSPITKGIEDLYGQFLFLDAKVIGFSSFWTFRNRYCILQQNSTHNGAEYQSVVGYQNVDELKKRIAPWSYRVRKDECLDLPPKMYVQREVPLSDTQRDLYRQLRRELLLEFEGKTLTAAMAAVRITKLQQILCGHIRFTDDGTLKLIEPCPRFDVVEELLEESDGQSIIWARFTADIDRLCKLLQSRGVSRYDGQVSADGRLKSLADFRSGRNQIFVGQPAAAGLGLNLVGPETVIYFSNSFDAEHRWQSEDRNHRAGAEGKHITYYDLVVPNSIDSHILKVLQRKGDVAASTLSDLRDMVMEEPE